ncbi:MAG: aminoacyl-histidine dipeptidase [Polaribacter sp.]|jgi:dipeptidase D
MNSPIKNLEPTSVWSHFVDLNAVPRPSKKEERVIQFMMDFGKNLKLETFKDNAGNVVIKKPATPGMENRKTVVLQGHLDMVHQKNSGTDFDFDSQGIDMYVDGDWVKANGTTLGADNGLGVAAIMAVLSSRDLAHPAIEALFTIDEETGMTGAMELDSSLISGKILLNLDTEEDDEIGIGCAGGVDVTAERSYKEEEVPSNVTAYKISITGLQGGHSGMDIHKGLGNANKLMNRLLFDGFTNYGLRISSIHGGSLRNAIPRESFSIVVIDNVTKDAFETEMHRKTEAITSEYSPLEPNMAIKVSKTETPKFVMDLGVQEGITKAIYGALNGIYRMSPDVENLVETSNNIAKVTIENGSLKVECLTRSSSETSKWDLANSLKSCFELAGCEISFSGNYPGWLPNINSEILNLMVSTYERLFESKPHVAACHAGLECGILGEHFPGMDMISFGPNILGAHSPDEKAQISSTQKFWKLLKEVLKNTPE